MTFPFQFMDRIEELGSLQLFYELERIIIDFMDRICYHT